MSELPKFDAELRKFNAVYALRRVAGVRKLRLVLRLVLSGRLLRVTTPQTQATFGSGLPKVIALRRTAEVRKFPFPEITSNFGLLSQPGLTGFLLRILLK